MSQNADNSVAPGSDGVPAEGAPSTGRRFTRRNVLQSAGIAAAVGAAAATGLSVERPQPSAAAVRAGGGRTGTIADLKHVVVITQENRSFDHILGTVNLPGARGFGDKQALTWQNGQTNFFEPNSRAEGYLLPYRADTTKYNAQNTSRQGSRWVRRGTPTCQCQSPGIVETVLCSPHSTSRRAGCSTGSVAGSGAANSGSVITGPHGESC